MMLGGNLGESIRFRIQAREQEETKVEYEPRKPLRILKLESSPSHLCHSFLRQAWAAKLLLKLLDQVA